MWACASGGQRKELELELLEEVSGLMWALGNKLRSSGSLESILTTESALRPHTDMFILLVSHVPKSPLSVLDNTGIC